MIQFAYQARTEGGELTRGTLRAATRERAAALLQAHGLTPVTLTARKGSATFLTRPVFGGGITRRDLILFCRQLSSLIQAGVPVLESLRAMERQIEKKSFHDVVRDLASGIEGGEALSQAMGKHPQAFNPFFLGVVRTGEASGRLAGALQMLSTHIEQDYTFMQRVRAALIYPAFVVGVVVLLSIIMLVFVLPQLTSLFDEAGVALPWPTRLLIAATSFFQRAWLLMLIVALALGFVARSYLKTAEGQYTASSYLLRFPGLRQLMQKLYLARLTSLLETLFASDVPIIQSLTLAQEAIGNRVYQRILADTVTAVRDGASLSSVWQHEPFIPPLLSTMVGVGEKGGNLPKTLAEAGRFFRRDVEAILSTITVLIEPVLIVVLGIGVGVIVAAVLLPIYNLVLVL